MKITPKNTFEHVSTSFDEEQYIRENPDAKNRVAQGEYKSIYEHFIINVVQGGKFPGKEFEQPIVSIIVPIYNAEPYLDLCLTSILVQDYPYWECILVNDASTDNSPKTITKFIRKDKRFRKIQHRANGGLSAARNSGIRAAAGHYITFLDSDDFMLQSSLRHRINALNQFDLPEVGGSYIGSITVPQDKFDIPQPKSMSLSTLDFVSVGGQVPFNANQPMVKTTVIRKLGGFNERLSHGEDWDLWSRILRHGYVFVPSEMTGVVYRTRKGSVVRSDPEQHIVNTYRIFTAHHQPMDEADIVEDVPHVYKKPWIEYHIQKEFAPRLFQFIGMNIDDPQFKSRLSAYINTYLPDFHILSRHIHIEDHIAKGLFRKNAISSITKKWWSWRYFSIGSVFSAVSELSSQSSETVKLSEEDRIPYRQQENIDIIFFPHVKYHVWTMALVIPFLEETGLNYIFVDSTTQFRDLGVRAELEARNLPFTTYNQFMLGNYAPQAVICMTDWDTVVKPVFQAANRVGIPTIAMVEGVQDYWDADTGRERNAYRTAKHIFLPGHFDKKYFKDTEQKLYVTGISRIDELRTTAPRFPSQPLVVINVNFTYNVLTQHRENWVESVVEACKAVNVDYVLSLHHADEGNWTGHNISKKTMYDQIKDGTVFISRFSTGILEALALGKPVIYHNPHGETVDKFFDPLGAYPITHSVSALTKALYHIIENPPSPAQFESFLNEHLNYKSSQTASELIANNIRKIVAENQLENRKDVAQRFHKTLTIYDNDYPDQPFDFRDISPSTNNITSSNKQPELSASSLKADIKQQISKLTRTYQPPSLRQKPLQHLIYRLNGLWLGIGATIVLFGYSLTTLPFNRITAYLAIVPFIISWAVRVRNRWKTYSTHLKNTIEQ